MKMKKEILDVEDGMRLAKDMNDYKSKVRALVYNWFLIKEMEGVLKEHYIPNVRLKREWFVNVEKKLSMCFFNWI